MSKAKKNKIVEYNKLERTVAALWTRVSSMDQEKYGCGLDFQDKICREYAEKITSPLLDEGEEIPFNNKQEILIDRTTWERANGITRCGYEVALITESTPLKRHVKCSRCGNYLTGYSRIKRNKKGEEHEYFYYKCNTKGCGVNTSSIQLHNLYTNLLDEFKIPAEFIPILTKMLEKVFNEYNDFKASAKSSLLKRKTELNKLIENTQVRYGLGEISAEVYNTTFNRLKEEQAKNSSLLAEAEENLSNHFCKSCSVNI